MPSAAPGAAASDPHDPLAPVRDTVQAMAALAGLPPLRGILPGLTVSERTVSDLTVSERTVSELGAPGPHSWVPAATLVSGEAIDCLLAAAHRRWRATPAAEAALAWKSYSYWAALPALLGYAAARRVPLPRPDAIAVSWSSRHSFVTVGLIPDRLHVAVLATDPVAATGSAAAGPAVRPVSDEQALLHALRVALMDDHFVPVMDVIRARVPVGARTLRGSVASAVAHAFSRAAAVVPGSAHEMAAAVLATLGLDDLVDIVSPAPSPAGLLVRRRTCCLAFTLPKPKICSDCCLRPPPLAATIDR